MKGLNGIIHYYWWTASIKPRLLLSRAGFASWGFSLPSVWYCHFACFYDVTLVVQFLNKIHYLQFTILKETDDEGPYHIFQSTNVCRTPRPRSSNVQQNTCRRRQWRVRQCSSCEIIEASCPGQTHRRSPCFARLQVRRLIQHTPHRTSTPRRHVLRLLTGLSQSQTYWYVRWIPFNTQFLLCLLVLI